MCSLPAADISALLRRLLPGLRGPRFGPGPAGVVTHP
jgi:hypothetical protein